MLPTFVIGLREGLEAALIVGIIAAFLRKQGRTDLLRWVFVGVGTAVLLCIGVGTALEIFSRDLPQKQQEGLETVVGVLAVAMVTYMVVWMRKHSRELKGTLEGAAAEAMAAGSSQAGRAMVVMAFLAVLREGFETVVFLLAAFNENGSGTLAGVGAALGIAVAVVLGWSIYRGGVTLNLSKFFRATGLVLALVAAGLVVTALHTAHEAGWLNFGQGATINLTWLVRPGSVQASLLTGMLGVQPRPVTIEVIGWLVYAIPIGLYVAWPPGRAIGPRRLALTSAIGAVVLAAGAVVSLVSAPDAVATTPVPRAHSSTVTVDGVTLQRRTVTSSHAASGPGLPATLTDQQVARLNGGRLPLGLTAGASRVPVSYVTTTAVTTLVEARTGRVISTTRSESTSATAHAPIGAIPLDKAVRATRRSTPGARAAQALQAARHDLSTIDRRSDRRNLAMVAGVVALALAIAAGAVSAVARRRHPPSRLDNTSADLVRHKVRLT